MWWLPFTPAPILLSYLLFKIHTSWAISQTTTYSHRASIHIWKPCNSSYGSVYVCAWVACPHTCVHMNINVKYEPSLNSCIQWYVGAVSACPPTWRESLPMSVFCDITVSSLELAMGGIFMLCKLANTPTQVLSVLRGVVVKHFTNPPLVACQAGQERG